jgi:hypothetical protein
VVDPGFQFGRLEGFALFRHFCFRQRILPCQGASSIYPFTAQLSGRASRFRDTSKKYQL